MLSRYIGRQIDRRFSNPISPLRDWLCFAFVGQLCSTIGCGGRVHTYSIHYERNSEGGYVQGTSSLPQPGNLYTPTKIQTVLSHGSRYSVQKFPSRQTQDTATATRTIFTGTNLQRDSPNQ